MDREAAFAGSFYPADKNKIKEMLDCFFSKAKTESAQQKTNCIIAPHAGYIYSGQTAAFAYSVLKKAKTFIILSPNHTGYGKDISIWPDGAWHTPPGKAKINSELSKEICEALGIEPDVEAHLQEHSIEVQLPFLQYLNGSDFDFVAITIATDNLAELKKLGAIIAQKAKKLDAAVIASSDFTHFEPEESAKTKDANAIRHIEKMEIGSFYGQVKNKGLSICGYAPIITAMEYCLTGKEFNMGRLLYYDSSATASHETTSVVGYAAIGFF